MNIKEMLFEFYDIEDDQYSGQKIEDTRRPRLTLRHLNRLGKMRELKRAEIEERKKLLKHMYNPSDDDGGGDIGI